MSKHDIADCPKCGKRDFILKEDGFWVCLNCEYTEKMPEPKHDQQSEPSILSTLFVAFIVGLFIMAALGL